MSPEEREATKHDHQVGVRDRPKMIAELTAELTAARVALDGRRKYRLRELRDLAQQQNIALRIVAPVMKKGWLGNPKGLKQVLWERGFIDERILDEYTVGLRTVDGESDPEQLEDTSLAFLLGTCLDFSAEETALENVVGSQLGVSVHITPKFHAEIAGEGIENSWGISKGIYRRKPLILKKQGREAFKALVKTCVNREVLDTKLVRRLSRRARAYISAYDDKTLTGFNPYLTLNPS